MSDRKGVALSDSSGPVLLAAMLAMLAVCVTLLHDNRVMLRDLVRTNQLVQAFFASTLFGALSLTFVVIGRILASWARASTFASVTILNKDPIFDKVLDFIGKQMPSTGALMAQSQKKMRTWKDMRREWTLGQRAPPRVEYRPANNSDVHIFGYKGSRILLTRAKGETVVAGQSRTPTQLETLTLSTWKGGHHVLKDLVESALAASATEQTAELSVYVLSSGWLDGWERALCKKPRPIESVILDEDLARNLLDDAHDFLRAADWYANVGIPYRRGYLLYGPPGCGKTSFCQAFAGALKLDVCMLTLANKNLDDNSLAAHLRDAPSTAIVLLEDVDAVFVERSASAAGSATGVTFSGLLNALDGVASQEGRLFFMTTNHIDRLDPALIRPGRCDVKVELRAASHAQQRALFCRFFPAHADQAEHFASQLPEHEISMAQLQGYLLAHKADHEAALAHVPRLLRVARPMVVDRTSIHAHLRRVGLERWAATFEHHGISLVSQLDGLSLEAVKRWSHALRADQQCARRMGLLLGKDEGLLKAYRLADLGTVKELFLQTFAEPDSAALPGKRRASRQPSADGLFDAARTPTGIQRSSSCSQLSRLGEALCSALQRDGKSAVSVWQLADHLHRYEHDAELCIARAAALVAERRSCPRGGSARLPDQVSTYEWLRRACYEEHADAFEASGYGEACAAYTLTEAELREKVGLKGRPLAELAAMLAADEQQPDLLVKLVPADWRRLRCDFAARFALQDGSRPSVELLRLADGFADALSDANGCGKVSLAQLEAFLCRHAEETAVEAEAAALPELLGHVRAPQPAPPEAAEPTEWVFGWLQGAGLEQLASAFIEHRLDTRESLLAEPQLQLADLAAIGVAKAGDQRRVLALLRQLRTEPQSHGTARAGGTVRLPW